MKEPKTNDEKTLSNLYDRITRISDLLERSHLDIGRDLTKSEKILLQDTLLDAQNDYINALLGR